MKLAEYLEWIAKGQAMIVRASDDPDITDSDYECIAKAQSAAYDLSSKARQKDRKVTKQARHLHARTSATS